MTEADLANLGRDALEALILKQAALLVKQAGTATRRSASGSPPPMPA